MNLAACRLRIEASCNARRIDYTNFRTERWPSGRRRTPGTRVGPKGSPGFESLSLRHRIFRANFPKPAPPGTLLLCAGEWLFPAPAPSGYTLMVVIPSAHGSGPGEWRIGGVTERLVSVFRAPGTECYILASVRIGRKSRNHRKLLEKCCRNILRAFRAPGFEPLGGSWRIRGKAVFLPALNALPEAACQTRETRWPRKSRPSMK